jgi:hypothetical protein
MKCCITGISEQNTGTRFKINDWFAMLYFGRCKNFFVYIKISRCGKKTEKKIGSLRPSFFHPKFKIELGPLAVTFSV